MTTQYRMQESKATIIKHHNLYVAIYLRMFFVDAGNKNKLNGS